MSNNPTLILSDELHIPLFEDPYSTEGFRATIIGQSGAGKSYLEFKILEEAFRNGIPFIALDPHGEGHVLSELSDTIIVISEKIDIPVTIEAIPVYVDLLKNGYSVVLDLSKLYYKSKTKFNEFAEEFIRTFLSEWSDVRRPILLNLDEAHTFAPQSKQKGSIERVELFSELATGGRKLGIMLCMATQRPARIDKSVISQSNVRLIGKITEMNDFKAIKQYLEKVTFKQIGTLKSGNFYAKLGTLFFKTKIHKRITTDAGETPDLDAAEIRLSAKQQIQLGDIAKRIQEAIEQAKQKQDQSKDKDAKIRKLESALEKSKAETKEVKSQLDIIEIVAAKSGSTTTGTSKSKVVTVEESAMPDVKAEFDRELNKLRNQFKKEMYEKDQEIEALEKERNKLEAELIAYYELKTAFNKVFGGGVEALPISAIKDEIAKQVTQQLPHSSTTYTVEPLEALKKDWEQRLFDRMKSIIDTFSDRQVKVLSYLIAMGKPQSKTPMYKEIFGQPSGEHWKTFTKELTGLQNTGIIYQGASKYGAKVDKWVSSFMEGRTEDVKLYETHIINYIREKDQGVA